uniref:Transposase n=1 Tax=Haemonchus placei TaxID=6290 RepID=A0A0N4VWV5_HAEPC
LSQLWTAHDDIALITGVTHIQRCTCRRYKSSGLEDGGAGKPGGETRPRKLRRDPGAQRSGGMRAAVPKT